ncbi:MAG: GGDEF domain-containing protein [Actinomycetota bacterium]
MKTYESVARGAVIGAVIERLHRALYEPLGRRSNGFLLCLSVVLMSFVAWADVITGSDVALSFFYLVPVSLATWFIDRRRGITLSVAGCVVVLLADVLSDTTFSGRFVPLWNAGVRLGSFLVTVFLLSWLKQALEQERRLARTDPLTKVANARHFYEVAALELSRARRYGRGLTLAYVDVDDFKLLNDDYGHSVGDATLCVIAKALSDSVRVTDVVARVGGDEFVVLFSETGEETAEIAVRRAHGQLLAALERSDHPVTVSIGAASFLSLPETVDELIWAADQFMYSVKRRGKNNLSLKTLGEGARRPSATG